MRCVEWSKLGPTLALLSVALLAVAWIFATSVTAVAPTRERMVVRFQQGESAARCAPVNLPQPLPRDGAPTQQEAPAATPEEQAAAGKRVIAGDLVRALGQAATSGNERAVQDLTNGLPRYGHAAREAIEEELGRVTDPKAKDALVRALARLDS